MLKNMNFLQTVKAMLVVFVLLTTSSAYYFYTDSIAQKQREILSKVHIFASMVSSVSKNNTPEDTLSQVQHVLVNEDLDMEYLLASFVDGVIVFHAYSDIKPPNIQAKDTHLAVPMRKALANKDGISTEHDYYGNKVFAAYTKIDGTDWGLVAKQPFFEYAKPLIYKLLSIVVSLLLFIITVYFFIQSYLKSQNTLLKAHNTAQEAMELFSKNVISSNSDLAGKITFVSDALCEITGYTREELIGKQHNTLRHPDTPSQTFKEFWDTIQSGKIWNGELKNKKKDGGFYWVDATVTPIFDIEGNITGYNSARHDISLIKEKEEELKKLAYYDSLTGLVNRKTIATRVHEEIEFANRNNIYSALIFIDLDGFKHINDALGHSHGDEVLKIIATRLSDMVRDFDVVGRMGGDEFIMLLRGNDSSYDKCKEHIDTLSQRIIATINEPLLINGENNQVGASLGIAFIPIDGNSLSDIIKRADTAMYKAKELGKNRAVYYNVALQDESEKFLSMKNEILQAFANNEFEMYYQAQYKSNTREVSGYEALIRWNHPTKGILTPYFFLDYIAKIGLNAQLDKYVYHAVMKDFNRVSSEIKDFHISINLCASSYEDESFIEFLLSEQSTQTIESSRITLEITEEALIKNIDTSFINKVKELGYRLSIDDFGTGYSSLSYISSINFDEIKLDMSFVQKVFNSEKDASVCNFILNMSKALNVDVIAEGVETEEQLAFVKEGGATVIQGYLFAKPEPFENLFNSQRIL